MSLLSSRVSYHGPRMSFNGSMQGYLLWLKGEYSWHQDEYSGSRLEPRLQDEPPLPLGSRISPKGLMEPQLHWSEVPWLQNELPRL
jgi:hypothetical protein